MIDLSQPERWAVLEVEMPETVKKNVLQKLDDLARRLGYAGLAARGLAMEVVFADFEPARYRVGFGG